jgi:cytochrome d ubiquinol oxidase subunit I
MVKFARKGPSILKTGRYHFENNGELAQDEVNRQVEM